MFQGYFNDIFQSIDGFRFQKYFYSAESINIDVKEEQSAFLRLWSNENIRLEFWIMNNVFWYIVYGTPNTFLIIGNDATRPFVITPTFLFRNTDESTEENIDLPILSFDQVKFLLKTKAIEYIFNQQH